MKTHTKLRMEVTEARAKARASGYRGGKATKHRAQVAGIYATMVAGIVVDQVRGFWQGLVS